LKITFELPIFLLFLYSFTFVSFLKNFNIQYLMPDASQLTISTTGLIIFIFFNIICNKTKLTSKLLMAFVEAERLHELKKTKSKNPT